MKLIFTILIVYLAYKVMFKPEKINPPSHKNNIDYKNKKDNNDYTDYEEVE